VAAGGVFEFVGHVEGRDIFTGEIDVVATDGFTGNIVLKTAEAPPSGASSQGSLPVLAASQTGRAAAPRAAHQAPLAEPAALRSSASPIVVICHGGSPSVRSERDLQATVS
jgi:hypothetical protein